MKHSANTHYPNASPLWSNCSLITSSLNPVHDGHLFWSWYPRHNYMIWFDTPLTEDVLSTGNICYRLQGNVWFCPKTPEADLPPEVTPLTQDGRVNPLLL